MSEEKGIPRVLCPSVILPSNQERLIGIIANVGDLPAILLATTDEEENNSIKYDLIEAIERADEFEYDIKEG